MKEREEVAVVTGAARGIGRRVALVLAEEGFRIVANDLAAPEETLKELRSAGAKTLSVPGTDLSSAEHTVKVVARDPEGLITRKSWSFSIAAP
jgi:NAD(P)-dependent dehydrogenase (short-subunit alcohol dehydrogenase family)